MSEIYTWIRNIVFFMILVTIVSNLLGKSDFKKYVNVVTGMLLVLIVLTPVMKIFSLEDVLDLSYEQKVFALDTAQVAGDMEQAEKKQKAQILVGYKKSFEEQIKSILHKYSLYLVDMDINIEEDYTKENFGEVKKLSVCASYLEPDESISDSIKNITIDPIVIGEEGEEDASKEETKTFETPMEIRVKDILSDFYNISTDHINVTIQGGKHE